MNTKERIITVAILLSISIMTIVDLLRDSSEGVAWWHVAIEGFVVLIALVGAFLLIKGAIILKHNLEDERKYSVKIQEESKIWKEHSKRYLEGLAHSIDDQLNKWGLTNSEKEVAFLLVKGFSSKEIAEVRNTSEKTVRAQSTSIYAKAGLSGRSQLSAFFLEDLLLPQSHE